VRREKEGRERLSFNRCSGFRSLQRLAPSCCRTLSSWSCGSLALIFGLGRRGCLDHWWSNSQCAVLIVRFATSELSKSVLNSLHFELFHNVRWVYRKLTFIQAFIQFSETTGGGGGGGGDL
jgi:hypothetical protein